MFFNSKKHVINYWFIIKRAKMTEQCQGIGLLSIDDFDI